jgi:hypothetical protein
VTIKLKTIVTGYRCRYAHDRPLVGCWPSNYLMREGNVSSYDRRVSMSDRLAFYRTPSGTRSAIVAYIYCGLDDNRTLRILARGIIIPTTPCSSDHSLRLAAAGCPLCRTRAVKVPQAASSRPCRRALAPCAAVGRNICQYR